MAAGAEFLRPRAAARCLEAPAPFDGQERGPPGVFGASLDRTEARSRRDSFSLWHWKPPSHVTVQQPQKVRTRRYGVRILTVFDLTAQWAGRFWLNPE